MTGDSRAAAVRGKNERRRSSARRGSKAGGGVVAHGEVKDGKAAGTWRPERDGSGARSSDTDIYLTPLVDLEAGGQQDASLGNEIMALHQAVWRRAKHAEFENLSLMSTAGLLAHKADINGMPPLYLAVYLGYIDTVEHLIDTFGAKGLLSYAGPNGQNVLHVAALRSKDLTHKFLQINTDQVALWNQADGSGSLPVHFAASVGIKGVTSLLLGDKANGIKQRDSRRMYPIHIAASVGAMDAIHALLGGANNDYASADLLDDNGDTFLHVAVKNNKTAVVEFVCNCKEAKLRSILNKKNKEGNTALHLAVQKSRESIFSHLLGNRHVELNHVNMEGYTPLDIASNIKTQRPFASLQNTTEWMIRALAHSGGHFSARRRDNNLGTAHGHADEVSMARSTDSVLVASALIATLTFAAAFTMPRSYKTDGHPKAGSYGFNAFLVADAVAFLCSVAATFSLAEYGNRGNVDRRVRCVYSQRAVRFFHVALKSVILAFVLGVSVVMWDISVTTTIIVSVATSALVLCGNVKIRHDFRLIWVMHRRFGLSRSWNLQLSTSSHLGWSTWWLRSFSATLAKNLISLLGTYVLIFLVAGIPQLVKLLAVHLQIHPDDH